MKTDLNDNAVQVTSTDLSRLSPNMLRRRRRARRLVDLCVVIPAMALSAPVGLAVAMAIRLIDPGPVLFRQERIGRDGRPFPMMKFRSMVVDSNAVLEAYLEANPDRRIEWKTIYKLDPDPRILPKIGVFLRRSSLDELPNLLNVLRGEMTLVGPRPFPAYHLDAYPPELRELRHRVDPGLTGLWQVVRGGVDIQTACDLQYLRNTSAGYDLRIILRTFRPLLFGKAHY